MVSTQHGTYCPSLVHFKMLSAICLNLDQSNVLLSGNGLYNDVVNQNTSLIIKVKYSNSNVLMNSSSAKWTVTQRDLTHSLVPHLATFAISKKLQTTTEMWLLQDFKIQIT